MAGPERNPAAGAALGALSVMKNRKMTTAAGAAMMAIGIAGMILVGSQALEAIKGPGFGEDQGKSYQYTSYVFMFTMIAGLIIVVYSQVSLQSEVAKKGESASKKDRIDYRSEEAA